MRLLYLLNGFKLIKRAKNNCLLFLVYFWYFSGLFLNRLGFFLKVFDSKQLSQKIKRLADSPGPPVSPPR
jgi:hypothetical protein